MDYLVYMRCAENNSYTDFMSAMTQFLTKAEPCDRTMVFMWCVIGPATSELKLWIA